MNCFGVHSVNTSTLRYENDDTRYPLVTYVRIINFFTKVADYLVLFGLSSRDLGSVRIDLALHVGLILLLFGTRGLCVPLVGSRITPAGETELLWTAAGRLI